MVIVMTSISFDFVELGLLAMSLNAELQRLEAEFPEEFQDPASYASKIKTLHRRILSTVPN